MAMKTASKFARLLLGEHVVDLVVEDDPHAHALDPADLLHQIFARQAIGGDAEMQHAAGQRPGLVDLDLMAEAGQVIGGRQAARAGADDQDALAARLARRSASASLPSPRDRRGSARPRGCRPRCRVPCGCSPSRRGDSRRGRARPASDCRGSALPRPRGTCRPGPGRARPGCPRRPGRRRCRAAAGRHRPAGWLRTGPMPLCRVRSTLGVMSRAMANRVSPRFFAQVRETSLPRPVGAP